MPSIQEIRQKYPQYSDMSDQEFADRFHKKFYSDMPVNEFYQKVGFNPQQAMQQQPQAAPSKNWLVKSLSDYGKNPLPSGAMIYQPDVIKEAGHLALSGLSGMAKGGENIARLVFGEKTAPAAQYQNANPIAETAGQYLPAIVAGGPSLIGQAISAGIHGLTQHQLGEKNILGLPEGRIGGALSDALATLLGGKAAQVINKGAMTAGTKLPELVKSLGSPTKAADKILESLGHGAKNVEDATISLGNDIRNNYNAHLENYKNKIEPVMKNHGDELIYEKANPLIKTGIDKHQNLIDEVEGLNVGDLFDDYKKNPTFENAHALQSELGAVIGDLSKNTKKGTKEYNELQKLKNVRDTLKDDINSFLESKGKNIADSYKSASDYYRENIVPYLSHKKLRDLLRGKLETVENLHTVFKSPSNIVTETNKKEIGPINKILQELPQESKDKILFSRLDGKRYANNPEKLADSINLIMNKGYGHAVSNDLKQSLDELVKKQKMNTKKKIVGTIAGTSLLGGGAYEAYKTAKNLLS